MEVVGSNRTAVPCCLRLEAVGRRFGALVAVSDVSLEIPYGERRAIIGANGAGKTTLFNTIAGDYPPTSGRVILFGQDVTRLPSHRRTRRGLRRTYQNSLLFGGLSVQDNIYLALKGLEPGRLSLRRPEPDDFLFQRAIDIGTGLGLDTILSSHVADISHGQQRQLEIAMAVAGTPKLILLDEPAAGLSPAERVGLVQLLQQIPRQISIIIIEHDMEVALRVAERITVMHQGTIVVEGTPQEIQENQTVHDIYMGKHVH